MSNRRVEACLEKLCDKGCQAVWSDIESLEVGRPVPEARGLSAQEVRILVRELKDIMAVYEGACSAAESSSSSAA